MRKNWLYGLIVIASVALVGFAYRARPGASTAAPAPGVPELPPVRGEEVAEIVAPPSVPAPITRNYATKVIVNLETIEKRARIDDGAEYEFWTFGGEVPGTFIRVREGDLVELHLKNDPTSGVGHNIDLHAVTGPHGGGSATITMPGEETVVTFRALNPGLYVYHCAMPGMVPLHIANGMYGLILVEPKEGLAEVDREYYVMQGDFYTPGRKGDKGLRPFDHDRLVDENPSYVLFNGAVGALTGENAMTAEVGETVRLFVGNGGPNLVSSFHVIGEIFDNVNVEGGSLVNHNVQTTLVPAGGAAMVELRVDVPGDLLLVDHSISRVFNKGALAVLRVDGPENPEIFRAGTASSQIAGH